LSQLSQLSLSRARTSSSASTGSGAGAAGGGRPKLNLSKRTLPKPDVAVPAPVPPPIPSSPTAPTNASSSGVSSPNWRKRTPSTGEPSPLSLTSPEPGLTPPPVPPVPTTLRIHPSAKPPPIATGTPGTTPQEVAWQAPLPQASSGALNDDNESSFYVNPTPNNTPIHTSCPYPSSTNSSHPSHAGHSESSAESSNNKAIDSNGTNGSGSTHIKSREFGTPASTPTGRPTRTSNGAESASSLRTSNSNMTLLKMNAGSVPSNLLNLMYCLAPPSHPSITHLVIYISILTSDRVHSTESILDSSSVLSCLSAAPIRGGKR